MKASQMLLRRKIAIAVCATALSAPVLSSCGFDYATDQPYTPAAGTNDHETLLGVGNAVVVAGQDDSGTFVAGLANNSNEDPITFTGLSGDEASAEFDPIEIAPSGYVNLADEDVHVTGTFSAGDVLDLTVETEDGTTIALEVPVVTNCDEFEGYDTSKPGSAAESETEDAAYSCEYAESESEH